MCKLLYKLIQQIAGKKMGPCGPCWSGCDQLKDRDDKLWRFFALKADAVSVTIKRNAASLVVSFIHVKLPFFLWYNSVINLGAGEGVNDAAIFPSFGVNVHPCLSLFVLLWGIAAPGWLLGLTKLPDCFSAAFRAKPNQLNIAPSAENQAVD
jgi:hypothetical protein